MAIKKIAINGTYEVEFDDSDYSKDDFKTVIENITKNPKLFNAIKSGRELSCTAKEKNIFNTKTNDKNNIEENLILHELFLEIFGVKNWTELKALFKINEDGTYQDIELSHSFNQSSRDYIDEIMQYEIKIQKQNPSFKYTDYQFFAVLFSEIYLDNQEMIKNLLLKRVRQYKKLLIVDITELKKQISNKDRFKKLLADILSNIDKKVFTKSGYSKKFEKKFEEFYNTVNENNFETKCNEFYAIKDINSYLSLLNRLAFYMATGSGKTHLLHINILQTKKYIKDYESLYILAPNIELAKQHKNKLLNEFDSSLEIGLSENDGDNKSNVADTIRSLLGKNNDINILTFPQLDTVINQFEKRNSLFANPFGNKNIVFVDEGHKGSSSEEGYRKDRNILMGKDGFCIEYSATFSQAIKDNQQLIQEYAKAIIFDYPYKRFYNDNYGKNPKFYPQEIIKTIIDNAQKNSKDKFEIKKEEWFHIFVEQICDFYQQKRYYEDKKNLPEYKAYNFSNPLMLLIGQTVDDKNGISHVKSIIELLNRFIKNSEDKTLDIIENIIHKYEYVEQDREKIFENVKKFLFYGNKKSTQFETYKISQNELAIKCNNSDKYFCSIYVGDVDNIGNYEQDHIQTSLMKEFFDKGDSPNINIVIAARKLTEGWDTNRITSIGLFELGKTKGSLVVQLFGRGVRLKGKQSNKLKRDGKYAISENFNVYGYDAEYLSYFIKEAELVESVSTKSLIVKIKLKDELLKDKPYLAPKTTFEECRGTVCIKKDDDFENLINKTFKKYNTKDGFDIKIIDFIDLKAVYYAILEKETRSNIQINYNEFKEIATIIFSKEIKIPKTKTILKHGDLFHNIAVSIFKEFINFFYNNVKYQYENNNLELKYIDKNHPNVNFQYEIKGTNIIIDRIATLVKHESLIDSKFKDIENVATLKIDNKNLAIKIDTHLYDSLFLKLEEVEELVISPDRLETSEHKFLALLQDHIRKTPNLDMKITVLRNQKNNMGIDGFYPDFIMWYECDNIKHIVFIDPKGLTTGNTSEVFEKMIASYKLKELEDSLNLKDKNIRLHSYILLNHKIEELLKITNIKEVCQVGLAKLFSSGKTNASSLTNKKIIQGFNILNTYSLEDENIIKIMLEDICSDTYDSMLMEFRNYMISSFYNAEKEQINKFITELNNNNINKSKFSDSISDKIGYVLAYITRDILHDENTYNQICYLYKNKELKEIKNEIKESVISEVADQFISEIIMDSIPYFRTGIKVVSLIKKIYENPNPRIQ